MSKIFVKPKAGLKVPRIDVRRDLAPEGEWVPSSSYWGRRIADGDVVEVKPDAKADGEKPKAGGKK